MCKQTADFVNKCAAPSVDYIYLVTEDPTAASDVEFLTQSIYRTGNV